MTTGALRGWGSLLQLDDGAGSYTTIAEVQDINGPDTKVNFDDATSNDSTNGVEEVIPTTIKPGSITFDIIYKMTNATHNVTTGIRYLQMNRVLRNWKIVSTDGGGSSDIMPAYVEGFSPKRPIKGKVSASISLQLSGNPTFV